MVPTQEFRPCWKCIGLAACNAQNDHRSSAQLYFTGSPAKLPSHGRHSPLLDAGDICLYYCMLFFQCCHSPLGLQAGKPFEILAYQPPIQQQFSRATTRTLKKTDLSFTICSLDYLYKRFAGTARQKKTCMHTMRANT